MIPPSYDMRPCDLATVRALCERFHGYKSMGNTAVYAFAVYESDRPVAAYAWQPPAVGAAKSVCPEAPQGVLALSRMVAVPGDSRTLNHVSKPLRRQMRVLIDRTRWPVLITYSDEGQGHTGHVYRCSGWQPTSRRQAPTYIEDGKRVSSYSNGKHDRAGLTPGPPTWVQRWEHWACEPGKALAWMRSHGWRRVPLRGKRWASGNQAYTFVQRAA